MIRNNTHSRRPYCRQNNHITVDATGTVSNFKHDKIQQSLSIKLQSSGDVAGEMIFFIADINVTTKD